MQPRNSAPTLKRVTIFVIAIAIAYYGYGSNGDNDLVRKTPERRQAATQFYYRHECGEISQMSIIFGDGPGFNKTYEFRQACTAGKVKCTFFFNPITIDSQATLKGTVEATVQQNFDIGLQLPIFPEDLERMSESQFKSALYGYAESVKAYSGLTTYPRFVLFKYFKLI